MSTLLQRIKASLPTVSFPHLLPTDAERDEAYLADSVDIYELEWRMRELDKHRASPPWDVNYGLGRH